MAKRSLFSNKYNGLKVKVQLVREGDCRGYEEKLSSSEDVVRFVGPELKLADREYFLTIFLNAKNVPLGVEEVSIGSLDLSIVHPREAMKSAVLASAASVVFVHNHPSGDPEPSREDIKLSERLVQAGELLGIKVLDHIIIAGDTHLSMHDQGLLRSK